MSELAMWIIGGLVMLIFFMISAWAAYVHGSLKSITLLEGQIPDILRRLTRIEDKVDAIRDGAIARR